MKIIGIGKHNGREKIFGAGTFEEIKSPGFNERLAKLKKLYLKNLNKKGKRKK
jgi:hypothetical protein